MATEMRSSREKVLAAITAIVVFGAIVFGVFIEPQLNERKTRLARMNKLKLMLVKMRGDLLMKDRIDKAYLQIEPLMASRGSDQQEISAFTRELSNVYSKLNIKPRSIKILPTDDDEEFSRRLSVKIVMQGHIREILKFILSVENTPNPVRIEQFDLRTREIVDNVQMTFVISKVVGSPEMKATE
jgi:hypothetical protein